MITHALAFFVGVAVMGVIWALYHNWKNHPDKLKEQYEEIRKKLDSLHE